MRPLCLIERLQHLSLRMISVKKQVAKLKAERLPVIINESDLKFEYMRGTGPGGQAVNKTNNCIAVTHVPTGIRVKCHATRFAELNAKFAVKELKAELDVHFNGDKSKRALDVLLKKEKKRNKARKQKKRQQETEPQNDQKNG